MQKILNISKKVARFLFIIFLKLLEGPKKAPVVEETNEEKSSGNLVKLIRTVYNGLSGAIKRNSQGSNTVSLKEVVSNNQRKTWTRVKQDFREWYAELVEEFEEKYSPELLEEVNVDKETKED